jgi:hypothetical protein
MSVRKRPHCLNCAHGYVIRYADRTRFPHSVECGLAGIVSHPMDTLRSAEQSCHRWQAKEQGDRPSRCKHGWTESLCPLCQVTVDEIAVQEAMPEAPRAASDAKPVSKAVRATKRAEGGNPCPFGRCPNTGRAYRSKTEARWAAEHPDHRFGAVGIRTAAGVYWPNFTYHGHAPLCPESPCYSLSRAWYLIEIKDAWIRDRALHKVKAAIRPAIALGFAGIWLAQWRDGKWDVSEIMEG